jgi:hypothetical protein
MRLSDLNSIQKKVLATIAASPSGEIAVKDLKSLYERPRGDGIYNAMLVRHGLLEWMRHTSFGGAYGIRITDAGRVLASQLVEEWPSAE